MDSLKFLERGTKNRLERLYVVHGDELFLRRQALKLIRELVLGPEMEEGAASVHEGDKAVFAAVYDELETVPFFHPKRLVLVENADPFVTRFRANLEKKIGQLPATGVLVLDLKSWPSNTKLYKLVGEESAIACKGPAAYRLPQWCIQWCQARQGKQLSVEAASLLVDLVGPDMGLLDQELIKLAIYVGERGRIDVPDVDRLVGNSRAENTWKIFDAIGAGQAGEALGILDRLLDQGEEPLRLAGAFSMQLRRLAQAGRLAMLGKPLPAALQEAGIPPFALKNAEQQLRHLGRRRAARLYSWLLELDLGLKGGTSLAPRTLLERLLIRLARKEEVKVRSP